MHLPGPLRSALGLTLLAMALGACSLGAALDSCADCGEVRSIDIRYVRVLMDRGGSRDFMQPGAGLRIGDRVEIRGGLPVARRS